MKKNYVILILLLFILASCKQESSKSDLATLKKEIETNEYFLAYQRDFQEIKKTAITQEISFKDADSAGIKDKLKDVKSVEDLQKVYTEGGIKNGDKLARIQQSMKYNLLMLYKESPQLREVNKNDLKTLLEPKPIDGAKYFEENVVNAGK